MSTMRLGGAMLFSRLASAAALLTLGFAGPAAAAGGYGNCKVTGQKGAFHVTPVVPGQLAVETSLPAPGWWNGDTPAAIKDGYEYCMAADIAYRAGLDKVVVVNTSFAGMVTGRTRSFDLALSRISITKERAKVVDFSIPYFASDTGVLVKKGSKVNGQVVKTLRIGVPQGTTEAAFVANVLRPTQPARVYPNNPAMMAALAAGQIDVAMADTVALLGYASVSNGTMEMAGQYKTGQSYGAIYPKGSPNEATFNRIILSLKDDGTLQKLASTYLAKTWGIDPTKIRYFAQ